MTKTIQRDYLREAYEIAQGKSKVRTIKPEHIRAVLEQVKTFEHSFQILETRMSELYNREVDKRKLAGLPPPPMPSQFMPPRPSK